MSKKKPEKTAKEKHAEQAEQIRAKESAELKDRYIRRFDSAFIRSTDHLNSMRRNLGKLAIRDKEMEEWIQELDEVIKNVRWIHESVDSEVEK